VRKLCAWNVLFSIRSSASSRNHAILFVMASLSFLTESLAGESMSLDKDKTIFGRHQSCDRRLPGKTVSREHFAIEFNNGKFFLVDLESVNGTFANGERVSWLELKDGDTIQAGPFVMRFQEDQKAALPDDSPSAARLLEGSTTGATEPLSFKAEHEKLYPRQYLEGIEHFNSRRYFDAHEVWEEIWLHATHNTKLFYQMLIQAAVGLHHRQRGNVRGALGMYQNVVTKLQSLPAIYMSINLVEFAQQFTSFFADLVENESDVPGITDKSWPTINLCDAAAERGDDRTQWE